MTYGLKLFACLLAGTALAWGVSAVLVLSLYAWPYPALVLLLVLMVLALRGLEP